MSEDLGNVYADERRAAAYDSLEYPATYYLAFRDMPELISRHVTGRNALDFGCGTGRSTRFLQGLGFQTVGVDIAPQMLDRARSRDPDGEYHLVTGDDLSVLAESVLAQRRFDLILCAFTFDNVPMAKKAYFLRSLGGLLTEKGRILNLVSDPVIYVNEWASFSTKDFPENGAAVSGDTVRIVMLDVDDRRPVEDVLCTDAAYREIYARASLTSLELHAPLGRDAEPYPWVSETTVSPWAIYVLDRRE